MHPAAMGFAGDPAQFPDERYDRVAGAGEPFVDAGPVEQVEMCGASDRLGCAAGDDGQFLLRLGERRFDIEPSLPAVFEAVEGADTGVGDARGSRQFITHGLLFLRAPRILPEGNQARSLTRVWSGITLPGEKRGREGKRMSMQDAAAIAGAGQPAATLGPLEAVHLRSQNYRNATDNSRITS